MQTKSIPFNKKTKNQVEALIKKCLEKSPKPKISIGHIGQKEKFTKKYSTDLLCRIIQKKINVSQRKKERGILNFIFLSIETEEKKIIFKYNLQANCIMIFLQKGKASLPEDFFLSGNQILLKGVVQEVA